MRICKDLIGVQNTHVRICKDLIGVQNTHVRICKDLILMCEYVKI